MCAFCQEGESFEENPIIFCDGCNIACHTFCYGLLKTPAGNWYCDRCKKSRSRAAACPACPSRDGLFKRTLDGRWGGLAHVVCTLYIHGPGFLPEDTMEKAAGFDLIPADYGALKCSLCRTPEAKRHGFKVQCAFRKCSTAFHVTCAQSAGLHMCLDDGDGGVQPSIYCKKHTPGGRGTRGGKADTQRKRKRS